MANNPLDTNAFKHYLIFHSLGNTDLYEIAEPIGFDASNFVQDQESKRYARSVQYGSIDKLTFVDAFGGVCTEKAINPQGDVSSLLEYGLQWLLYIYNQYGFESKVEYVLEKNGVQFSNGMLDFTDKGITDGYTYITTKLIQKNKVANLKRRLDDKFNLFGVVNAKNEPITPCPTIDFLRKAQPITNSSSWSKTFGNYTNMGIGRFYTISLNRQITDSQIHNTITPFCDVLFHPLDGVNREMTFAQHIAGGTSYTNVGEGQSTKLLIAQRQISNINVNVKFQGDLRSRNGSANRFIYYIMKSTPSQFFNNYQSRNFDIILDVPLTSTTYTPYDLDVNFVSTINLEIGEILYGGFSAYNDSTFIDFTVENSEVSILATETAINTVVKGVRWIDGIKQASKFTSDLTIDAELFDVGGVHYNNVLFNRRSISGVADNFPATPKLMLESVEEVNCDYEPDEDKIFIGHETDFYVNEEVGVFNIIPDEDFTIEENDRFQVNKLTNGYKTFQQDRTVLGTSNAIHTESEFRILNENVENVFERKAEFIRDPFTHQATVDLEITQPSTSTTDDDKVNIVEVVALAPSSFNEFGARLLMRINVGKLEILNRDSNGETNDVVINWTILGLSVGSSFEITFGENVGSYTVFAITSSVLTLTPISFTPTFEGDAFIRMKYYYTNVLWTTRTNEGFISNPLSLQNANYSIKRNITNYFGEHLASCLLYSKKDIPNAYFKSNGAYTSQLTTESLPVVENALIAYDSLPNPLISAKVMNGTCVAEFEDVLAYLNAYKTVRGFVRLLDSKGNVYKAFLQKLDQLWAENKLKTIGEQKFETQYLILTYAGGILTVNDAQYNLSGVENWYVFQNDFIKLYDAQNRPLSNYYRYDYVKLNGVIYDSKELLSVALESL